MEISARREVAYFFVPVPSLPDDWPNVRIVLVPGRCVPLARVLLSWELYIIGRRGVETRECCDMFCVRTRVACCVCSTRTVVESCCRQRGAKYNKDVTKVRERAFLFYAIVQKDRCAGRENIAGRLVVGRKLVLNAWSIMAKSGQPTTKKVQ